MKLSKMRLIMPCCILAASFTTAQAQSPEPVDLPAETPLHFTTSNGKLYFGIGGKGMVTANYDIGNPVNNNNGLITSAIELDPTHGNKANFGISGQQTTLNLNLVALPGLKDQIGLFLEVNLMGDNYTPDIEFAYIRWRGLTAGYNYGLFSNEDVMPNTIDEQGPNAALSAQSGVVDYTHTFSNGLTLGAGLEMPVFSGSYTTGLEPSYSEVSQRVPDIPVSVSYDFGSGFVKGAAIFRNLIYRNDTKKKNADVVGWGVSLSGQVEIIPQLDFFFAGNYGRGIASYIQDLTDLNLDIAPDAEGKMKGVEVWSSFGGLTYSPTEKLSFTGLYSHVRNYAAATIESVGDGLVPYSYAQYVGVNAFYKINSFLTAGVEYLYGRRVQFDGLQGHVSRIQAALSATF